MTASAFFLWLFCLTLCAVTACAGEAEREKVILDCDMVESFDDGVAMVLLANAPTVDLLGVTTVSGNTWANEGAAYAIRQLEIEGREVPVAIGARDPLRPGRREAFPLERKLCGIGPDAWVGSFDHDEPLSWESHYRGHYGREPEYRPDSRHAVAFIIETVRANPGEVTIAAIGPCTNIALAVRQAPDIVPLIKRVVYMGGAFFKPGNVTPAGEFNWWFDPEAARATVRSAFPEQIAVGLDVCEKVVFTSERYQALVDFLGTSPQVDILRSTFVGTRFQDDHDASHFIWDVIVAALIIDPTVVTGEVTCAVDVNDQFGLSYGHSLAYEGEGPEGARPVRIVTDIDEGKFWNLVMDKRLWNSVP